MRLDPDTCYQTMLSRDRRFDGWFFVGVSSTGIYCRPVCPVRTPQRQNCHFFSNAAAAERAGFRPCLRCRPELAPGNGLLDVSSRLARAAATLIEEGFLNTGRLADLAARVGVTDRHLRRIFDAQFGVSLMEFAQTQRLLMAKRLLTDTRLPVNAVALTAGFGSVRRFNDLFLKQYGLNPLRFRKETDAPNASNAESVTFPLGYRPPFCWSGILAFLARRQTGGVEHIGDEIYTRTLALSHKGHDIHGWFSVRHMPQRYALEVTLPMLLMPVVGQLLPRVRRLFDLDSRPDLIDPHLGDLADGQPGMRVPGAVDGFEIAVCALAGQSPHSTNTQRILSRIAERFGTQVSAPHALTRVFPSAAKLAREPASAIEGTGMTRKRAEAIVALAIEVSSGRIRLEPAAPLEETLRALRNIHGIGEWAVQYIAMRALAWPNAFPPCDLKLKKRLGYARASALGRHAGQWEPWRAYATLHMWSQLEGQLR
ncbi:AlkA N-terminal domain-containing protein [Paraburkholderia sp. BR10937]|uniref:DNA-3-methyladenine glycosylase 2 family protein n=1 Tax=Paraburkholderia sp. BR10937 TaxID=3236994 RepID=UPI0034D1A6B2